jgi:hypothetical protein
MANQASQIKHRRFGGALEGLFKKILPLLKSGATFCLPRIPLRSIRAAD